MGNALRDQMLKAGLVNEKQVKKAQQEKRKETRQTQHKPGVVSEQQAQLQAAAQAKAERDRQLNRERQEEQEQKARLAQVRQLIEAHRVPWEEGEIVYNFEDAGKIKRMHITDGLRKQLIRGRLAIVRLDQQYVLVEADIAEKIAQRDASSIVLLNTPPEKPAESDTDPYAAYAIPDDLIW